VGTGFLFVPKAGNELKKPETLPEKQEPKQAFTMLITMIGD